MTSSVLITGGAGFLGWHLRCHLEAARGEWGVRPLSRAEFSTPGALEEAVDRADVIFHLAGANAHESDVAWENVEIAERLVRALSESGSRPSVVYANTRHALGESPYGKAKATAAEALESWARSADARFEDVILPNLFGEGARPHYNSVVATFCDDLISGRSSVVSQEAETELLHVQSAAEALEKAATDGDGTQTLVRGRATPVAELHSTLARLFSVYSGSHDVPDVGDRFDLTLLNQLRFAMFPHGAERACVTRADRRGRFFEAVRGHSPGQTSFSTTVPGVTRGEHWHKYKVERFLVLAGEATIRLRRLFDAAIHDVDVTGDRPVFVDMPTLYVHDITNVGDGELVTMFWTNDHFDPEHPDTYAEQVDPERASPC